MRTTLLLLLSFAMLAASKPPASVPAVHPFLSKYRSDEHPPQALLDAYVRFAETARAAAGDFGPMLLPQAADITREARPEKTREYGSDINLPFLRSGFIPMVDSVSRHGDDAWLIRTDTTAIWFVQTKSGDWRIYRYLDKPIE